jgi:hypothetical protein
MGGRNAALNFENYEFIRRLFMVNIKLGEKEYPIRFDMAAMKAVQDRYGNVQDLAIHLRDLKEMYWILATLINEGYKYEALELNIPAKQVTPEQISIIMEIGDFYNGKTSQSIIDAFNEALGDGKKYTAEELKKIADGMTKQNLTATAK